MPRKKLEVKERPVLAELVPEYFENKSKQDELKKKVDAANKEIKRIMESYDEYLTEDGKKRVYCVDGYKAVYSTQERVSLNEDALAEYLVEKGYTKAVKQVWQLDTDALEALLYNNEISLEDQKEIARFKTVKSVAILKVEKEDE